MSFKAELETLRSQEWFRQFAQQELEKNIPPVLEFNPVDDNTERWRYECGKRVGYLMALSRLGIKRIDQ